MEKLTDGAWVIGEARGYSERSGEGKGGPYTLRFVKVLAGDAILEVMFPDRGRVKGTPGPAAPVTGELVTLPVTLETRTDRSGRPALSVRLDLERYEAPAVKARAVGKV